MNKLEIASLYSTILVGVRNGLSFTKVCESLNLDVIDVSQYIRENDKEDALRKEASVAFKKILNTTNNILAVKDDKDEIEKLSLWVQSQKLIKTMKFDLILWGDLLHKYNKRTPLNIKTALEIYRKEDVATGFEMNMLELNIYIETNIPN